MGIQAPRRKNFGCRSLGAVRIAAALTCGNGTVSAAFVEPVVFASDRGVLDIVMIARPKPIPSISFAPRGGGVAVNPVGWAYEICRRPANADDCPPAARTAADY